MATPEIVGLAATVITCGQVLLQTRLVVTSKSVVGVEGLTWVLAFVQSVGLLAFSIDRGLLAAILANAFGTLASSGIVLVLIARVRFARGRLVVGSVTATACLAVAGQVGGPALLGTLGAVTAAFVWLPQAIHSIGTKRAEGLSVGFVLAGISSSALWIAYASLESQWRLGIAPAAALFAMVVTGLTSNVSRGNPGPEQHGCVRDGGDAAL